MDLRLRLSKGCSQELLGPGGATSINTVVVGSIIE
jgi:hypothetical protein